MRYVCCVLTRSGPLNRPAIGGHWVSARPGRRSAAVPHRSGTGTGPGSGWWERSMRYVCSVLTGSGPLNRPAIGGH